jgi:hypothetical protein
MSARKRIIEYLEAKGITRIKFTEGAGLPRSFFCNNSGVSASTLERIRKAYPDIDLDYIIMGVGSPILPRGYKRYPTLASALNSMAKMRYELTGESDGDESD